MADTLLTESDTKERLSIVYAEAVAAKSGYTTTRTDLDRDGVDLRIQAGGQMRPALEFQLKATSRLGPEDDGVVKFELKRRNYDLLRLDTQTPRLLVVLNLPHEKDQWLTITPEELTLRNCAYWLNLRGWRERSNTSTVTVPIPTANLFDDRSLRRLMSESREGRIR